jgi:hypothetical protein
LGKSRQVISDKRSAFGAMAAIASLEEFLVPCIQSIFAPDDSARQEAEAQLSVWGDQVAGILITHSFPSINLPLCAASHFCQ